MLLASLSLPGCAFIIFFVMKKTVGIRVSEKEELEGLDGHEHGMDAYPDFRLNEH